MKKILTNKDEFVGRRLNEIITLNDIEYTDYKLYMFDDDTVLIEKFDYDDTHGSIMSGGTILFSGVDFDVVDEDPFVFEYQTIKGTKTTVHYTYTLKPASIKISPFGKEMIARGIVTKEELISANKERLAMKVEEYKLARQRDIDECIAILARYGIEVKTNK